MNVELVAQMFKNYQSNVLFHLEGMLSVSVGGIADLFSYGESKGAFLGFD